VIDGLLKLQERITRERPGHPVENIHGRQKALDFAKGEPGQIVAGTVRVHTND
jgi:hypothetical protein